MSNSKYMLSRRDGYDLRLSMMQDQLTALPRDLFGKIMGVLSVNEAATRIQRFFRGLDARIRQIANPYEAAIAADAPPGTWFIRLPKPTRTSQSEWLRYVNRRGTLEGGGYYEAFRKLRRQPPEIIYSW